MSASRIALQPAGGNIDTSPHYASLSYDIAAHLGRIGELKALTKKHRLGRCCTITTTRLGHKNLASLAAFEADLMLLLSVSDNMDLT